MRRPIPIRRSLLAAVLLTIVVLGGGILALAVVGSRRAIRTVATSAIEETVFSLDADLQSFFDPVRSNLTMLRDWGERGLIDPRRPDVYRSMLEPFLRQHPHVSSVILAESSGAELMLLRLDGKWMLRQSTPENVGRRVRVFEWTDGAAPTESMKEMDYDPRQRPWYRGAVEADGAIHWTDAYTFYTTRELGITASVAFEPGLVVALDVLLRDVSDFTGGYARGRRDVLVMNEKRQVVGLPGRIPPERRKEFYLKRPQELGIASIGGAVAAVDGSARTSVRIEDGRLHAARFEGPREPWWAAAASHDLDRTHQLWICVIIPESELLHGATELRIGILALTVVMLLIGVIAAFRLARRFSLPIEALVRESDRISQGELDKGEEIESSVEEVRRLAAAHDRMRESLQTLFKLEQDLRIARQIQQDTFPDRLPVVKGYDLAAWSDPADETGGDTYDVVGLHRDGDRIRLSHDDGARVLFLLGDATGHGIGPALSVTQMRAMLRMAARRETDLRQIVRDMNEQLCADLEGGRFITTWIARLDPASHVLRSLSAGQGPILHYCAGEDRFEVINPDMPPLGILGGVEVPEDRSITLGRGDVFAVLSDGIFEAMDGDGGLFGTERVEAVLRQHRKAPADAMLHALRDAVAGFTKGAPATDDRTAVIVKRH